MADLELELIPRTSSLGPVCCLSQRHRLPLTLCLIKRSKGYVGWRVRHGSVLGEWGFSECLGGPEITSPLLKCSLFFIVSDFLPMQGMCWPHSLRGMDVWSLPPSNLGGQTFRYLQTPNMLGMLPAASDLPWSATRYSRVQGKGSFESHWQRTEV